MEALLVSDDELLVTNDGAQVFCISACITSTCISTNTLYMRQVYKKAVVVGLR